MMPDISVIIPCFNAEEYIVRCVEKLEEQTFKSFEVIIVDDCSNDNSVKLLEQVRDKSSADISIIKLEKNSVPGVARNVELKMREEDIQHFVISMTIMILIFQN